MSTKLNWQNQLILLAIAVVWFLNLTTVFAPSTNYPDYSAITDSLESVTLRDSLPFEQYKSKVDSLIALDLCNKVKKNDHGAGLYGAVLGYTTIHESDACIPYTEKNKYYVTLAGYRLKKDWEFHTLNGRYYIKGPVWSVNDQGVVSMKRDLKEIPIRYAASNDYKNKGMILLPVTESGFRLYRVLTWIVTGLLLILGFIVFVILPFRILYSIAMGEAFSERNTRYLSIIAWTLIGLALVPSLLALLFSLIFSYLIPGELYLPVQETLLQHGGLLTAGLIALLVRSAFKNGARMKRSLHLTV